MTVTRHRAGRTGEPPAVPRVAAGAPRLARLQAGLGRLVQGREDYGQTVLSGTWAWTEAPQPSAQMSGAQDAPAQR